MLSSFLKLISSSRQILITSHENPDADAIGSCLAIFYYLKNYWPDKTVYLYNRDPVPKNLRFLAGTDLISQALPTEPIDLLIVLDAGSLNRTGLIDFTAKTVGLKTINIGHHSGQQWASLNLIRTKAAAATEIIYDLFNLLRVKIEQPLALYLLCGIVSDTANFQHSNTTSRTLVIAADLIKKGISLAKLSRRLRGAWSIDILKIWGKTLSRAKVNQKGILKSVITAWELNKIKQMSADYNGLANLLNSAEGVKYIVLFVDKGKNQVKISLRSEPSRGINVASIAKSYGGGGHPYAAGFTIPGRIIKTRNSWKLAI